MIYMLEFANMEGTFDPSNDSEIPFTNQYLRQKDHDECWEGTLLRVQYPMCPEF